jgi:hypothetical protein
MKRKRIAGIVLLFVIALSSFSLQGRLSSSKAKLMKAFGAAGISSNKMDFGECPNQTYTVTYPGAGTTFDWYVEWSYANHPLWPRGRQYVGSGTTLSGWDLQSGDVLYMITDAGTEGETEEWETIGTCQD